MSHQEKATRARLPKRSPKFEERSRVKRIQRVRIQNG
ncbi:Uncharacterised protein [Vibrio cholerae]|nr:Uncharacterised protein [Vibrio cholerae]